MSSATDSYRPYAGEEIMEAYYKATLVTGIAATMDYQYVTNPAYDAARGSINVYALRLHVEF